MRVKNLVLSAMFIALGIVLPFITGQIPEIGSMLLPLHIPVLICGFVCGPVYAMAVGIILPIMRSFMFGMPPLYPMATSMAIEMGVYGLVAGLIYIKLPKSNINIYVSLITSMILGRVAWGIAMFVFLGMSGGAFTMEWFISGAFLGAIPGIILQLVMIPPLVIVLNRTGVINGTKQHRF